MIYGGVLCPTSVPGVLSGSTMRHFHASSIRYDLLTNGGDIRKYWVCRREKRLYKIDAHSNENGILDAFSFSLCIAREGWTDSSVKICSTEIKAGAQKEPNTPLNLIIC